MNANGPQRSIALVAASNYELAATIKRLGLKPDGRTHVGHNAGCHVRAIVSGIGAHRTRLALEDLFAIGEPGHVIDMGFAGGLDPSLWSGQVLMFHTITNERRSVAQIVDDGSVRLNHAAQVEGGPALLTIDRVAGSVQEKRRLFETHAAAAVDMESYHVARFASEHGVRLSVLRAIVDTAKMELPSVSADWVKPDGTPAGATVMRYMLAHPSEILTLLRLRRRAATASQALSRHVEAALLARNDF